MRTGELYQRYYGLYLGTVVDVNDPQKLGRVRIKCDQYEDFQDDPTWCSVARPAAGQTSVFFTPKEGDQVVFAFLVGDVNEPIILGYAHQTKDRPAPEQVSTVKHGVVTNIGSVVFDEQNKKIVVTFGTDKTITMSDDGIEVQGGSKIRLQADRVEIQGDTVCVNGQGVVLKDFFDITYK